MLPKRFASLKNKIKFMDPSKISPQYFYDELYRYVRTYHHTYKTHTKARWINMNILDMFTTEFKAYDAEYYVSF
jgi:hypothetical protein